MCLQVSALQQADLADQEVATLVNLDKLTFENSQVGVGWGS